MRKANASEDLSQCTIATDSRCLVNKSLYQCELEVSLAPLESACLQFEHQPFITIGSLAEKMGTYGKKGRIELILGDRALINWGYSKEWLPTYELYPLDESGKPILPGEVKDIFQVARRGRIAITAQRSEAD